MTNIVSIPEPGKHREEAGLWLANIDAGLSETEKQEFREWLAFDDQNAEAFKYLARLWDDMGELSRLAEIFPEEGISKPKNYVKAFSIAASTVFAVIAISFFIGREFYFQTGIEKTFETSIGEHSTVSLADGSVLTLNTNSLVTVSYKNEYRLIALERGEIHITVAHDESRPLSVKAGDKVVQAIGTAFNIQLLESKDFELIVTEGKVRVGDRTKFEKSLAQKTSSKNTKLGAYKPSIPVRLTQDSLSISKGERVVIPASGSIAPLEFRNIADIEIIEDVEIQKALSWREGNLSFNGESLEFAISEISRYTSAEFQFETEDLKSILIAGMFKSGDVNGLLSALEDSFDISSRKIDEETFRLYR